MNQPTLPNRNGERRIISVSAAPYDGYAFPRMLESLASIGATHVEPVFSVGFTEPFDESVFTEDRAGQHAAWLIEHGVRCHAFSSHMDLGRADAVDVFKGRMDFARRLGAKVIITNAASRNNARRFYTNTQRLVRHAEQIDMWIGLENPGDGSNNLLNLAADGPGLLERIGSPRVGLNYDAGNTISHRHGIDVVADAVAAMPMCLHTHIKDVRVNGDGYFFTAPGEGQVGCDRIVGALARTALDVSIEIPLRLHRGPDSQARRRAWRVPLADIELVLRPTLQFVQSHLNMEQPA
jgi:sugar phosphate isomerase/epimerase